MATKEQKLQTLTNRVTCWLVNLLTAQKGNAKAAVNEMKRPAHSKWLKDVAAGYRFFLKGVDGIKAGRFRNATESFTITDKGWKALTKEAGKEISTLMGAMKTKPIDDFDWNALIKREQFRSECVLKRNVKEVKEAKEKPKEKVIVDIRSRSKSKPKTDIAAREEEAEAAREESLAEAENLFGNATNELRAKAAPKRSRSRSSRQAQTQAQLEAQAKVDAEEKAEKKRDRSNSSSSSSKTKRPSRSNTSTASTASNVSNKTDKTNRSSKSRSVSRTVSQEPRTQSQIIRAFEARAPLITTTNGDEKSKPGQQRSKSRSTSTSLSRRERFSPSRLSVPASKADRAINPHFKQLEIGKEKNEDWLQQIITNDANYLKKCLINIADLNRWKIDRYNKLMREKAGNEDEVKRIITQYVAEEKKDKRKEEEKQYRGAEKYVIELYKHRQLVVDMFRPFSAAELKKKKKTESDGPLAIKHDLHQLEMTSDTLKKRLLSALNDPDNGIRTLTGVARESLRLDLVRSIFSLQTSTSPWKRGNNIVLIGESGSGKTKASKVIGFVYSQMGVLATTRFSDVPTTSLISNKVGDTAPKTEAEILNALEAVILIDEAYRMVSECDKPSVVVALENARKAARSGGSQRRSGGSKLLEPRTGGDSEISSFGIEAVTQIVAMLADLRGLIVVIVAGYAPNMKCWLASNDGLERRFLLTKELTSYPAEDLTMLFMKQAEATIKDNKLPFSPNLSERLTKLVSRLFKDLLAVPEANYVKRQAGDIDIIAAYFAHYLSYRDFMELTWPYDAAYIVLLAFHAFLKRVGASFQWVFPKTYQSRLNKNDTLNRVGGYACSTKVEKAMMDIFGTTRMHFYTDTTTNRLRVRV